ncbi:mitochondrial carnitine/acylcarnitine carrier protein-like [Hylaeus anthracinus]|uniref:mitochondrial carnitine/acylcarnitine carrier protein-like n=1 Tax=Hylaeus anthracinus TaxID=313031 RepID=UPI0023B93188|nr:mitochondrial carnitine/acylcarnitine carrier protein-like [Hylaeus anthracinus]
MTTDGSLKILIAGAVGGLFNVITGHPLDTIKVRLQTMPHAYKGTWDTTKKLVLQEGPCSLYKVQILIGVMAPVIMAVPIFALGFLGFGFGKELVSEPHQESLTGTQMFLAGMFSGACTSIISAPVERIKCLLQIQLNFFTVIAGKSSHLTQVTAWQSMMAGGCAGMVHWAVALPVDTVKSKLQTSPLGHYPRGFRSAFVETVKKDGLSILYNGIVPVMLRAFPANAAFFCGVEVTMKFLDEHASWI